MEALLDALPGLQGIDWRWSVFFGHLPVLLDAARITVFAALAAFVLAVVLALPLALARESKNAVVRRPAAALVEFVRRTPLLVQIYAVYYALPDWGIVLPALAAGVLTLGVHYAAYISEVYRAGLASVPPGQRDACRALGLPPRVAFFRVIAPQALRPIAPALGNHLITLFKETPLLSAIAVVELLQRAKIIGSMTFRYTEAITAVGLVFLVVSLVSAVGLRRLERRLGVGADPGRVP